MGNGIVQFKIIVKLMMIAVSLFPTSVDPERMFSLMNNVKTDKRNCLKFDTIAETMRIHEHCRSNREIGQKRAKSVPIGSYWFRQKCVFFGNVRQKSPKIAENRALTTYDLFFSTFFFFSLYSSFCIHLSFFSPQSTPLLLLGGLLLGLVH